MGRGCRQVLAASRRRGDRGRPAQPGRAPSFSSRSDPLDAVEAAPAALGGRAKRIAKSKDGDVEAIRVLVVATRSARFQLEGTAIAVGLKVGGIREFAVTFGS